MWFVSRLSSLPLRDSIHYPHTYAGDAWSAFCLSIEWLMPSPSPGFSSCLLEAFGRIGNDFSFLSFFFFLVFPHLPDFGVTDMQLQKNSFCGTGEVARWLRAIAALPGAPRLVPSTYMVVHKCTQLQGFHTPFCSPWHVVHIHTSIHTGKALIHI